MKLIFGITVARRKDKQVKEDKVGRTNLIHHQHLIPNSRLRYCCLFILEASIADYFIISDSLSSCLG